MKLKIEVRDEAGRLVLDQAIDVPDDIPFPDDQHGEMGLVGLKTAIDYHLYEARRS